MTTRPCNPHPIDSDGTSWRQRALAAQAPEANPVDGRDLADLINYAQRYAGVLQYWVADELTDPATVKPEGDWRSFVGKDVSALVARISNEDVPALRSRFETLRAQVEQAPAARVADSFNALYGELVGLAVRLDGWFKVAPDDLLLSRELESWIGTTLGEALRTIVAQLRRARAIEPAIDEAGIQSLEPLWQLEAVLPDVSLFLQGNLNHTQDQQLALEQLAQAHGQFLQVLQQLLDRTPEFLTETLEKHPRHQPHMALLLAFLQLFGGAQQHLNRLTAEHLNFYYRKVLGLVPSVPVADSAHLVLEPAKNLVGDPKIAKGTEFKAGKDDSGTELIYVSDDELVINAAQVDVNEGLKSVFVALEQGEVASIYAATDADSADGEGAEITDADGRWATFGSAQLPFAELGFAVASPMLELAEGERTILLRFDLDDPFEIPDGSSVDDVRKELRHNVIVQGTGADGWIDIEIHEVEFVDDWGPCLKFRLFLEADEAALQPYDETVHSAGFSADYPLLRFLLDNEGLPAVDLSGEVAIAELPEPACEAHVAAANDANIKKLSARSAGALLFSRGVRVQTFDDHQPYFTRNTLVRHGGKLFRAVADIESAGFRPGHFEKLWTAQRTIYPYRYLQHLEVRGLRIDVTVRGVRDLVVENDQGVVDPAKPFMPFGASPKVGSSLLLGSREVFSKQLGEVRLDIGWAALPTEGFAGYYQEYTLSPDNNQFFKATAAFLNSGDWVTAGAAQHLFDDAGGTDNPPAAERCLRWSGDDAAPLVRAADPMNEFKRYAVGMRQGFMRFTLTDHDFGQAEYPQALATAVRDKGAIPNLPHVPQIAQIKLSYKAHQIVDYRGKGADAFTTRTAQLFQVWPFGQREIWPIAAVDTPGIIPVERRLLPHFEVTGAGGVSQSAEGSLFIGLKGLDLAASSKNLTLLMQVAEGSADPELPVQPVVWSYLLADVWHDFSSDEILADGTNGLLRSGIIKLVLPREMTHDNQILPANMHWLRASVVRNTGAVCELIALHTQVISATFVDRSNDPAHLSTPLAADSIAKLRERQAAVKKVSQPYASSGGRMQEPDGEFNVRVSERLRHKGRAITLWDYERLVLQEFPEIYKVKCINHADRQREHVTGNVRVVVVPDLRNRNAVDPLRPRASLDTLDQIEKHLAGVASDFIAIHVTNPEYEAIRAQFQVRFHDGYDQGYYLRQLVTDIQDFLSPWRHDEAADISFGGRIHRSKVLLFVEQREYVDFVTKFRIDQQLAGSWCLDVEEAVAGHAGVVLTSAEAGEYQIGVAVNSCEDSEPLAEVVAEPPQVVAVGPRFVGNTRSRELHDLNNFTPMCHLEMIAADHRRRFFTIADARGLDYDLCAHCFGRDRSRR